MPPVSLKPSAQTDFAGLEGVHLIVEARFSSFDYESKDGTVFTGIGMLGKFRDSEGNDKEQFWSVGSPDSWEASEDGTMLESVSGVGTIKKSSNFGIFVQELDNAGFGDAASYRINGESRRKRVDEMLDVVDLDFKRDAFANTLSRGQTQRLGLARTLLHDPQVLLLDEPLSGLDPRARIEMRNLLRRLGEMGKTIIVSSHILPELADVCNKVGIIDKGELKQNATKTEVIQMVREHTVLVIQPARREQLDSIRQLLERHAKVQGCELGDDAMRVVLRSGVTDYSDIPRLLIEQGIDLRQFNEEELDLESAFMALTKGTSTRM